MKIINFVLIGVLALSLVCSINSFAQERIEGPNINASIVDEALDDFEHNKEKIEGLSATEKHEAINPKKQEVKVTQEVNTRSEKLQARPNDIAQEKPSSQQEQLDKKDDATKDKDLSSKKGFIVDHFQVKEMDIKDALGLLSLKSGLDIVFDKNIKGAVTVSLNNVRAIDALRIILDMSNLAYNEISDKIHIMTLEEFESKIGHNYEEDLETRIVPLVYIKTSDILESLIKLKGPLGKVISNDDSNGFILIDTPTHIKIMVGYIKEMDISLETEVFTLKETRAKEILQKVEGIITKGKGSYTYDEKTNRLDVTDTFLKVKEIEGLINEYANNDKQIELTVKVIEIVLSEEHIQGVDWEAIVSDYESIPLKNSKNENMNQDLSIGTITEEDYEILVDALDTVGDINPVSNFKEMLINQKKSKVALRLDVNEVNDMKQDPEQDPPDSLVLFLTPRINKENLSVDVNPVIYNFEMNSDKLQLKIDNGSTIVLGSIFKKVKVEKIRGVPFLRELPIFKIAFRRTRQSTQKLEFVIFLTFKVGNK